jgi:CHAD domain-containing protein
VVEQRSPEALHQMRVALRRLRSALGLFRPLVPPEQHARLTAGIRWLTEVLAPARDADVFLADLLAPVSEAFGNDGEMRALEGVARERRDAAHAEAVMALRSPRYAALLLLLGAALEGRSWRAQPVSEISAKLLTPIGDLADELLATRHRKARKAGRRFARLSEEERHRLRIALKKLRYAADFFRSLYAEKEVKRYVKRLARLQSALGHNNDVMMATHFLESLTARRGSGRIARLGSAPGKLVGWYARGVHEREAELVTEWHRFRKTKPFWRKRQEQPALEEPGALRTVDN